MNEIQAAQVEAKIAVDQPKTDTTLTVRTGVKVGWDGTIPVVTPIVDGIGAGVGAVYNGGKSVGSWLGNTTGLW